MEYEIRISGITKQRQILGTIFGDRVERAYIIESKNHREAMKEAEHRFREETLSKPTNIIMFSVSP